MLKVVSFALVPSSFHPQGNCCGRRLAFTFRQAGLRKRTPHFALLLMLLLALPFKGTAQEYPGYDEFSVEMNVPQVGIIELPIAIQGEVAYLSVTDIFQYLRIKNEKDSETGLITGFLLHPDATYQIIPQENRIVFRGEEIQLDEEAFIYTPMDVYLRSDYFGEIFGLHTDFNFRTLSVDLDTELELPIIREKRLERMRDNIREVKGEVVPDTTLDKQRPILRGGTLDWGIITTQQTDGENDHRFNLGVGAMVAGGEANVLLNYSDKVPFRSRNQFYQWRYVNNENPVVTQMAVGKISTRATSSLFAPVVGVQLSNTPVRNRRSFGTYTLSDVTEPGWTVELYVNNILIDYVEADASGFFKFEVPLMYGNTNVNLRFYGPWGEERTEERLINIPYNFIPKNELEYTLSAGVVENDLNSKFSRFNFNYGLGSFMTVGGGVEYLSSLEREQLMPFLNTSVSLASNLLFSGEYTYGVKAEGLLSYRTPGNFQIDLNYVNYDKDQTAINYNYLEERKISMSAPIRTRLFSAYARFSINQIILPTTEFTSAQLLLSGMLMGVNTNITTYALFNDRLNTSNIYSTLSQSYRLPYRFLLSPQVQYNFDDQEFTNLILRLERPIFERGFFNLGFENNFLRGTRTFELGLRYTFNFAQTSANARIGNQNSSFVQSARGSVFLDDRTGYAAISDRGNVGKAAVTVIPFLDMNGNGERDEMEPNVPGLELKNAGGRMVYNEDRTVIRIFDLEPYVPLLLEADPISLDNIAWRIENPKIMLETIPNQFTTVHIPVSVLGEVAGMVYFRDDKGTRGQGRIIINILDENGNQVTRMLTEGDGYFSYLGLKPGRYTAEIDRQQLQTLNYTAAPGSTSFEIEVDEYGDFVDTLEFVLSPLPEEE